MRPATLIELARPYLRPLPASTDDIIVLPAMRVQDTRLAAASQSPSRVYIPVVCRGMVRTYERCVEQAIEVGIDGKCSVARGGWRILCAGVLARAQELTNTTLARTRGERVQHAAYTLQCRPLTLFIVSSEGEIN